MINSTASGAFDALFDNSCNIVAGRPPVADSAAPSSPAAFFPEAPQSLKEAGLNERQAEELVAKFLMAEGSASGWEIAEQIALPFRCVEKLLHTLKAERIVVMKATSSIGDFVYELTELGTERAARYFEHCTYCGAAPVPLADYVASVSAQSLRKHAPSLASVRRALGDLVLEETLVERLGEAMTAGLGFFLYGPPGNGKTSIAERVTSAYGEGIWIPRTIIATGEIIRLYDPACHKTLPIPEAALAEPNRLDRRWIYIQRPTIVAGGELLLEHLEVTRNPSTGIHEAPLQLKSNCGTLVIDDFGRQRVSPTELLNRWILPLERRFDILSTTSGKKLRVPFDQLIVFATNIEPRTLVDEAFLRRIPYKIDVLDPSEVQFHRVWRARAAQLGIASEASAVEYLLETYYRKDCRALRYCHAGDLLEQVLHHCRFRGQKPVVTKASIDAAVQNYFGIV